MNSYYAELFDESELPKPGQVRPRSAPNLLVDDETFQLERATGRGDRLCRQLEDDSFVTEVLGPREYYTHTENGDVVKASSTSRFTPTPTIRIPKDTFDEFIKAITDAPVSPDKCPCACESCMAGKCLDCQWETKCANCEASQKTNKSLTSHSQLRGRIRRGVAEIFAPFKSWVGRRFDLGYREDVDACFDRVLQAGENFVIDAIMDAKVDSVGQAG